MKGGFIFDQLLCVNCKACSAACTLENRFPVKVRSVLNYNSVVSASVACSNLSLACNHCEIPVCLDGCPVSAYTRDPSSGAIIIDDAKCIGCKYCIWNCPFDAPRWDSENKVIGKCHLCYSNLGEDLQPACTSACPTGALGFGDLNKYDMASAPDWYPGIELNPGMRFYKKREVIPLKISPDSLFSKVIENLPAKKKSRESQWSLILFSFLSVLSVSLISSSLITSELPDRLLFMTLTLLPGAISLFHLGKWYRAWRSVRNIKNSPLSREILAYIIYFTVSSAAIIFKQPFIIISASVAGLILLLLIDAVYIYTSGSLNAYYHSGQTFITALLIISFLSGSIFPFLFISTVKVILIFIFSYDKKNLNISVLRFIRLALLIIACSGIGSGISHTDKTIILILLTGELIDRILFYFDFNPSGINDKIHKHIISVSNEKRGD